LSFLNALQSHNKKPPQYSLENRPFSKKNNPFLLDEYLCNFYNPTYYRFKRRDILWDTMVM